MTPTSATMELRLTQKRKRDQSRGKVHPVTLQPNCVVHVPGLRYGPLTLLSSSKYPEDILAKMQDIKRKRLAEPDGSNNRMKESCDLVPDVLLETHGFHRECYQRFTMNLNRLKQTDTGASTSKQRLPRRSSDCVIFNPDCIFCKSESRKKVKKNGYWTSEGLSNFDRDGWQNVIAIAESKYDEHLLRRIRGLDLFACEAKYHNTCRWNYVQNPHKWRSVNIDEQRKVVDSMAAHRDAMKSVSQVIDDDIIAENKILKLSDLRLTYVSTLDQTPYPNPEYRSEKLKDKLVKYEPYRSKLSFCDMGKFQSHIVYNSDIDVNTAVKHAFELGSIDTIANVGSRIRQSIVDGFAKSEDIKWPPTAQDLGTSESVIPVELEKLLTYVIVGKPTANTPKGHRLVMSIGQDICRAATNGSWKLPKHILICMTLRHLFRSEKLITLFNRMGHSESYSFSLELQTAIAEAVDSTSTLLSNQIVRSPTSPAVFHSEFDNFDQLINDLTGMDSVHTAHGIMMQDIEGEQANHGGIQPDLPTIPKSKQRSLKLRKTDTLPECYVSKRDSPVLVINQTTHPSAAQALQNSRMVFMVWAFIRKSCQNEQEVPSWTGFMSLTGEAPTKLTTIDYYPVIAEPITNYKTVQECLRYAEEATTEVDQQYVISTFDLGVCMKAFPLIWNNPVRYEKHIIMIGTFHLTCAYLKMIGKKMNGSGLSDILLEAGLIGSGSLDGVMSGRHYERAMHCHKVMLECLERLLLDTYQDDRNRGQFLSSLPDVSAEKLKNLIESPCRLSLDTVLDDDDVTSYIKDYMQFQSDARNGQHGKTAQLWTSYMDHVRLVLSLTEAVKKNDFLLYLHSIGDMADLFFSFGGQNYARYLTYFSVFLANIETSHPGATELIKRGAISVARSFIPGNRCAVDKTMEETFMRHAKSRGGAGTSGTGVSGLLTNYDAYQRWVRTTHARSQFVNTTLNMADMLSDTSDGTRHRDVRPVEILKSERDVKKACEAVESFLNPFAVEAKDKLLILTSGAAASTEVEQDVLQAEKRGKQAKDEFISARLKTGRDFFEPVKRLNLKTLSDMNKKSKVTTAKHKIIQYKQQGNIAFQLFVKSQNQGVQIDLKELMTYPLTPVPYSIGTADGFLAKTDKSKGFQYLTKDCTDAEIPPEKETLTVHDGNATFYCLKDLAPNFSQICKQVFNVMGKTGDAVFSTDQYLPNSVKALERQRRGNGEKLILKGEATKKPPEWKLFLSNDDNKAQFIRLMQRLWSSDAYAPKLQGRQITFICDGAAHLLTSHDGKTTTAVEIPTLKSSQEETDSRVILYCEYGRSRDYRTVRVKSPDSDVFYILLHYAARIDDITIIFDTGSGNRKRLVNVTELAQNYTPEHCTALMALHAFTGCDSTSAFKGIGKVKPLKTLLKMPKYVPLLSKLGDSWNISSDLIDDLDAFTCALYGRGRVSSVNDLRLSKINELCAKSDQLTPSNNVDMATLPPCRRSLVQHIKRVNYQVGIWKRAHITNPDVPDACTGHGWTIVDGHIEPLWYDGELLPRRLADIANTVVTSDDSDDDVPQAGYELDGDDSESDLD